MSETDKHNLAGDQHSHNGGGHDAAHAVGHRIGHLDSGEPITDSDINYGSVIYIGVVGTLLTIAIVYYLVGLYWSSLRHEQTLQRVGSANEIQWQQFAELRTQQQTELLGASRWTDPARNLVSLPMDEAIKLTLQQEQLKQAAELRSSSRALSEAAAVPAEAAQSGEPGATQTEDSAEEAVQEPGEAASPAAGHAADGDTGH